MATIITGNQNLFFLISFILTPISPPRICAVRWTLLDFVYDARSARDCPATGHLSLSVNAIDRQEKFTQFMSQDHVCPLFPPHYEATHWHQALPMNGGGACVCKCVVFRTYQSHILVNQSGGTFSFDLFQWIFSTAELMCQVRIIMTWVRNNATNGIHNQQRIVPAKNFDGILNKLNSP